MGIKKYPFFRLQIVALIFLVIVSCSRKNEPSGYYDRYVSNSFVEENIFLEKEYTPTSPPTLEMAKEKLPDPFWEGHQNTIDCYWKTWEIAFGNIRQQQKIIFQTMLPRVLTTIFLCGGMYLCSCTGNMLHRYFPIRNPWRIFTPTSTRTVI